MFEKIQRNPFNHEVSPGFTEFHVCFTKTGNIILVNTVSKTMLFPDFYLTDIVNSVTGSKDLQHGPLLSVK